MDRTIVVGLGRSGIGAARLLHHNGTPVSVIERGQTPQDEDRAAPLRQQGIEVSLGCHWSRKASVPGTDVSTRW